MIEKVKKLFGGIDLSWKKLVIFAIIAGVYTAIMAMLPIAKDTSFADITISFEVWILFGILIIMNSKSAKDSALKCLVFFVISQPLIYLVQDVINHTSLFVTYYRNWIGWTIACIPMGYIGFFMKKDKWWGLLILVPIMILLGLHFEKYLGETLKIKIDRPFGTKHPKHGFIYPVNYGYVPNTISGDGEELDAYLLGVFEPVEEYEGECIAIIHRTNDNDDKLVVVPIGKNYSNDAINALTEFQEQYFEHEIIRNEKTLTK